MLKIRYTLLFVLAILAIGSVSFAADFYVDDAKGNDSNSGTLSKPWKTITKANNTLKAGHTVYIRGGNYNGQQISPINNGSSKSRIIYRNYNNEVVVIQNSSVPLKLNNRSYITIHGIKISNCDKYLSMANGHHNHLSYLNISDMRNFGGKEGFLIGADSTYNWIHHCTIGGYGTYSGGNDRGNMISIGEKPSGNNSYNLIEDNHFYHGGHGVLYLHGKYNVVRNNYLHNEEWSSDGYGNRCGEVKDFTSGKNGWNLIENNRFAFTGKPIDASYSDGLQFSSHDNILRGNIFYSCKGAGLKITPLTSSQNPDNNYIYNNVFFNNGIDVGSSYQHALWFRAKAWRGINGTVVKNNIFWQNKGVNIRKSGGSPVNATIENNWESGNPYFVDAIVSKTIDPFNKNYPDFNLKPGSPCIDAGAFLTTTTGSGNGTTLPIEDAHYFMDGWGIIQGDIIQLENQTQTAQIIDVDYSNNILTLDKPLSWTSNQGVSLKFSGAKPDLGAFESGMATDGGGITLPYPTNLRIVQN